MVYVRTHLADDEDENSDLVFEWRETAASDDTPRAANDDNPKATVGATQTKDPFRIAPAAKTMGAKRNSFGSRTLMRIVPASVGGSASVRREGAQFVYVLTMPSTNFERTGQDPAGRARSH